MIFRKKIFFHRRSDIKSSIIHLLFIPEGLKKISGQINIKKIFFEQDETKSRVFTEIETFNNFIIFASMLWSTQSPFSLTLKYKNIVENFDVLLFIDENLRKFRN